MNLIKRFLGKLFGKVEDSKKEVEKANEEIAESNKANLLTHPVGMPRHFMPNRSYEVGRIKKMKRRRRLNKIGHETRRVNNLKKAA